LLVDAPVCPLKPVFDIEEAVFQRVQASVDRRKVDVGQCVDAVVGVGVRRRQRLRVASGHVVAYRDLAVVAAGVGLGQRLRIARDHVAAYRRLAIVGIGIRRGAAGGDGAVGIGIGRGQ